jgi:protein SCO1/2
LAFGAAAICATAAAQGGTSAGPSTSIRPSPEIGRDVGVDQRLDKKLPLDLVFFDESGRRVTLGDYFGKRPVVMTMVYYKCPSLCNEILNGLLASLRAVKYDVGTEFDVVVVSIDPIETPELAAAKKASYVESYNRPGSEIGWHFLTGSKESIEALASAVGYRYEYDPKTKLYAHGAAIWTGTTEGKISQYFYGIEYSARDVQFALVESSKGKIGSLVDQAMLYCFVYDPATGKYGFVIMRVLRVAGILTVLALATFIFTMVRRERARRPAIGGGIQMHGEQSPGDQTEPDA